MTGSFRSSSTLTGNQDIERSAGPGQQIHRHASGQGKARHRYNRCFASLWSRAHQGVICRMTTARSAFRCSSSDDLGKRRSTSFSPFSPRKRSTLHRHESCRLAGSAYGGSRCGGSEQSPPRFECVVSRSEERGTARGGGAAHAAKREELGRCTGVEERGTARGGAAHAHLAAHGEGLAAEEAPTPVRPTKSARGWGQNFFLS